jgi:cyclic-di-AMP phosphodiesterase PgpH
MNYERQNEAPQKGRLRSGLLSETVQRLLVLVITAALVVFSSSGILSEYFRPSQFQAGQIANRTIRAPRDFFVVDSFNTEKQRADAERAERRVFEFDDTDKLSLKKEVHALFQTLDSFASEPGIGSGVVDLESEERAQIERAFSLRFLDVEWAVVANRTIWPALEQSVADLVFPVIHRGVMADKAPLESVIDRSGATLFNKDTKTEAPLLSDSAIYSQEEAEQVFESLFPEAGFKRGEAFDSVVRKIGLSLIKPNVRFDREKTEERIKIARDSSPNLLPNSPR